MTNLINKYGNFVDTTKYFKHLEATKLTDATGNLNRMIGLGLAFIKLLVQ